MALTVTTRIEAIQLAEPLDETDERKGFVDVAIGSMRVNGCSGQRVFESTLGALTYLWVRLLVRSRSGSADTFTDRTAL